ncbi:HlyD family secretion protein [Moraxella canis]|uniref:RND transporter n=1 Tax=Moraxella canis TaxID=90239 RepID=A0A1S9ZIV1_9GAMM|nr:biotin/lipoyl-binding protein [Moraxella canis]OOR83310.1 RND transporter [Moraxella canis]
MTDNTDDEKQSAETGYPKKKSTLTADQRKRIAAKLLLVLIGAVLGVIIFGLMQSYDTKHSTPAGNNQLNTDDSKSGLIGSVRQKIAKPTTFSIQGRVEGETVNISTKLPSRIDTIYVKEGQTVKAGDPLVELSSPEIEAKKQQAAAMLQSALAFQASTDRGTRQENVDTLYANWQSAEAQAALAADTFRRSDYLYQEGVISRQRRDEMQAAHQSSAQIAHAAHQQYLKAERGRTDELKSSADAQVQIARAAVAEANALEAETMLYAPIDGTVSKIYAQTTELIMPAVPVMSLLDNHPTISINIQEDQYSHVQALPKLTGFIPALNKSADFKIVHTDAEGEFATIKNTRQSGGYDIHSFKAKLEPIAPIEGLKVGMSVVFDITVTP